MLARTGVRAPGRSRRALARGRDPAPRARLARPVRARRGPRRARLPRRCWPTRADAQAFRRAVQAPRRGVGTATSSSVVTAARERHGGDLIAASARAARARPASARSRRATRLAAVRRRARARPRASTRAGRSLGHVVVATVTLARRRWSPTTSSAATARRDPSSAATPSACSRTCARCAAPPRPSTTSTATGASLHRLPRARRRPARPGAHGRRGPPHHRLHDPPRQGHRGRSSSLLLGLRGAAAAVLARARSPPTPRTSPRSGGCSTSPPPAPRTGCVITHAAVRGGRADRRPLALPHRGRPARATARPLAA